MRKPKVRTWMAALCDPGVERVARPFPVTIRGVSYDCATNGHACLLVKGATLRKPKNKTVTPAEIDAIFRNSRHKQGTITLDRLRAWAWLPARKNPSERVGFVLDIPLNECILARYVAPAELKSEKPILVRVGKVRALDPVIFEAADWKLVVMPMRVGSLPVVVERPKRKRRTA